MTKYVTKYKRISVFFWYLNNIGLILYFVRESGYRSMLNLLKVMTYLKRHSICISLALVSHTVLFIVKLVWMVVLSVCKWIKYLYIILQKLEATTPRIVFKCNRAETNISLVLLQVSSCEICSSFWWKLRTNTTLFLRGKCS